MYWTQIPLIIQLSYNYDDVCTTHVSHFGYWESTQMEQELSSYQPFKLSRLGIYKFLPFAETGLVWAGDGMVSL